jgi:3-hydroxyisobutyrate dehydrogenase
VLRTRFPLAGADESHPANRDFEAMFTVDLIVKDLALACDLAAEHGLDADAARTALAAYARAQEHGLGRLDYSAVYLSEAAES